MASTTYTSTLVARSGLQARGVHAGLNAVSLEYSCTSTLSSSGCVFLCRVPAGSFIHGFIERHTSGATACTIDLGITDGAGSHSYSAIASGLLHAANNIRAAKAPYLVPVSGGPRIVTASLESGTASSSFAMSLTLFYSLDTEVG